MSNVGSVKIPPRYIRLYRSCPIVIQWFQIDVEPPKYPGDLSSVVMYSGLYLFGLRVGVWRRNWHPPK